jgi:nucleoside-diphosphate-sugar epimerase
MAELIERETDLEEHLSTPYAEDVELFSGLEGDLMILGVGGKMGPSLARRAWRSNRYAGTRRKIIGVSRFSTPATENYLRNSGIETIRADLLNRRTVSALPEAQNVIFMAGRKFGSTGAESLTWAMNAYTPALVAERFPKSRIVVFSSGAVYPFTRIGSGGASEDTAPAPLGEYASSVLARERIFEHFSLHFGTPITLLRLNYAVDLRYGALLDIASKVFAGKPIDLTMGYVNVIWQGDANSAALRSLTLAKSPPFVLNVTGPETISVRELAARFGQVFSKAAVFKGEEAADALLSDTRRYQSLFGPPVVSLEKMIEWTAQWVLCSGPTLNKPTHFEIRDGKF